MQELVLPNRPLSSYRLGSFLQGRRTCAEMLRGELVNSQDDLRIETLRTNGKGGVPRIGPVAALNPDVPVSYWLRGRRDHRKNYHMGDHEGPFREGEAARLLLIFRGTWTSMQMAIPQLVG